MKSCLVLLVFLALGWPARAAESASVTLFCNSLRFSPSTSEAGTLSLTTDSSFAELNGELAPTLDPSLPGYGSLFELSDPATATTLHGQVFFDTPPPVDANGNGFDDFQEVSQAVPSTSTRGVFATPVDQGTVTAEWSREAGAASGTCTVQLTGDLFGPLPAFNFTFHLLVYAGRLAYVPSPNSISGGLNLTNVEVSTNIWQGIVQLERVSGPDRFDHLTWQPGALTNELGQALPYGSVDLQRDTTLKTNYYGFPVLADGDPGTSTIDYQSWTVSIDDPNDANGDGIPDLSDDPPALPAPPPSLALTKGPDQLLLTVTATAGQSFVVEENRDLGGTNWLQGATLLLTNSPQSFPLALPDSSPRFWRLHAPAE